MSLINDALKRASEAEKRRAGIRPGARRGPKGPEALGPPIEPVKKARPSVMSQPSFWMAMFTITLVVVSGAFFYSWWTARTPRFKLHVPEGKDALEMMIVDSKPKPAPKPPDTLVLGADGEVIGIPAVTGGTTNLITSSNVVAGATNTTELPVPIATAVEITNPQTNVGPDKAPGLAPTEPLPVAVTNAPTILVPTTLPSMAAGDVGIPAVPDKLPGVEEPKEKTVKAAPFPEILLKGIVIMRDKATAFVNGKTMKVGEHVGEAELVEIGVEYVKFKRGDEVRKFFLLR